MVGRTGPNPDDGSGAVWGEPLDGILARDGARCVWCSTPFGRLARPTREHVLPRVKGGPSWPENLVAACGGCNRDRGHASPVQHLDEVRQQGRTPRPEVVRASLERTATRVRREGGARRIRPQLRAELRKLGLDADLGRAD
jgi:5-methylcytosine-specific restriction endonuclease McrA